MKEQGIILSARRQNIHTPHKQNQSQKDRASLIPVILVHRKDQRRADPEPAADMGQVFGAVGGAEQEVRDLGQDQRLSVPGGEIGEARTCAESLQPLGLAGSDVRAAAQPEACSQSGGDPDQAQDPYQRHQVSGDEAVCTPEAGKTAFPRPGGGGSGVRLFIVQQIVHRDAQQTADGQEFVGAGQ